MAKKLVHQFQGDRGMSGRGGMPSLWWKYVCGRNASNDVGLFAKPKSVPVEQVTCTKCREAMGVGFAKATS